MLTFIDILYGVCFLCKSINADLHPSSMRVLVCVCSQVKRPPMIEVFGE